MCIKFSLWSLTSGSVEVVGWHSCKLGPKGVGCLMGIFKGICHGMIYCRSPFEAGVRGLFVPAAPVIIPTGYDQSQRVWERDASPVGSTCLITDFSRKIFIFSYVHFTHLSLPTSCHFALWLSIAKRGWRQGSVSPSCSVPIPHLHTPHRHMPKHALLLHLSFFLSCNFSC